MNNTQQDTKSVSPFLVIVVIIGFVVAAPYIEGAMINILTIATIAVPVVLIILWANKDKEDAPYRAAQAKARNSAKSFTLEELIAIKNEYEAERIAVRASYTNTPKHVYKARSEKNLGQLTYYLESVKLSGFSTDMPELRLAD